MSSRHSKGKLSNNLHLSAERKKNRGENLIAWRKRQKENAKRNVAVQCGFEREQQVTQLIKQDISATSQEILSHNPVNSSNIETNLNTSHQPISFTLTHLPYSESSSGVQIKQESDQDSYSPNEHSLPSIKHSFSLNPEANLETNLDSHQQSSPTSLNHLPCSQDIQVNQVPNQDSYSSSENSFPSIKKSFSSTAIETSNSAACSTPTSDKDSSDTRFDMLGKTSLPSIKKSFTLSPMETSDLAACSTLTSDEDSSETRFDMLGKNWAEKMKSLTSDQRIYAEKLINDVFFLAELGRLRHVCRDGELWLKIDK